MRRFPRAPARRSILLVGVSLWCTLACVPLDAQQDPRARVDALVESGRVDAAERLARESGGATATQLAEILARRGRLHEADSAAERVIASNGADERSARVLRAELSARRGDRAAATAAARALIDSYEGNARSTAWSARDQVAVGRAYLLLSARDASAVRAALRAFDAAATADTALLDAPLRAAELFLAKYNGDEAKQGFVEVLKRRPSHPRALLGLARVHEFAGSDSALILARLALRADPALAEAHVFVALSHLEAEANDSALAAAGHALAADSSAVGAWAAIGAVGWLRGDSAALRRARDAAARVEPRSATFFVVLADAAARQRRYADAGRFSALALERDSLSVPALGTLGTNRLRGGDIAEGRAYIERAFAIDPFNVWHKNTLDLLDKLATFTTVRSGRFEFVAPAREADALLPYLTPLLEEAYDSLAARYGYRPPTPVRLEIYDRHADFSVRTVGLTGLGALGVSFGRVLAMDAPSARDRGSFNWGSTAWHELAHTFSLGLSGNRVPRWFSEGLSVLEERRARAGWGAAVSAPYLEARAQLRPLSRLNDGFVRPRQPAEVGLSYYHASLACEMIEEQFGVAALGAMLRAWGEGLETPAVFKRVLKVDEAEMDRRFEAFLAQRFKGKVDLDSVTHDADVAPLIAAADARAKGGDAAGEVRALERALWIWPYDAALHARLADAAARAGDHARAVRSRRTILALAPTDRLEARYQLARSLFAAGDRAGARREVLGVLEEAPSFEKAQALLLELRASEGRPR